MSQKHLVLIAHNFVEALTPAVRAEAAPAEPTQTQLATVLANLAYYGYAPALDVLALLRGMSRAELTEFWRAAEPALKSLTGADRNMDDFVVYKNFPKEVLALSQVEYWLNQIFMYLGAPNEWFTEPAQPRPPLNEKLKLKVLRAAMPQTLAEVYANLVANKSRWTEPQRAYATFLAHELAVTELDLAEFGFKENGLELMAKCLDLDGTIAVADATDVLRLAAAMSEQDVSLRQKVVFRKFSRGERRLLLGLLEETKNLQADMGLRQAQWKMLLANLHPGDYKFAKVSAAYDALYRGAIVTFNSEVEAKLATQNAEVLALLQSRPGDFARRLHKLYAVFGDQAVAAFTGIAQRLTTLQLLKLRGYVSTVNNRAQFIHPPKGNWSKAKFVPNWKTPFSAEAVDAMRSAIDEQLALRLKNAFPDGVDLDIETADVKLQTNDQELASYGRGTVFPIPKEMTFLRLASFWAQAGGGNTWYDNGVNFFSSEWTAMGTCCWNHVHDMRDAAVFSGDPTNSKDLKGRGCQMVDLYLDKLAAQGVRYAVWNVLCFSNLKFSQSEEVLATLQWGVDAAAGKLYEPGRAQMVFPLKGDNLTKYVAYIDVVERKLVYMDANLAGKVDSAGSNAYTLQEKMPAFVEYLNTLPSVADLFVHAEQGSVPVLYSDETRDLEAGALAYVFQPTNPKNLFESVKLAALL